LLEGKTTFPTDKVFNETTFQAGEQVEARPDWFEVRLEYLHRLFDFHRGGSLWLLVGVDYHYINWRFSATGAPGSPGNEGKEDFYLQTFPLPVFGARYLLELNERWSVDVRADGFRANHWRHWEDEGGPIYTSSTIIDGQATIRWQPLERLFVELGYVIT